MNTAAPTNKKPTDRAQGLENPWEETKHSGTASGIRAASEVENNKGGQAPVHRMSALTQHIHLEGPTHDSIAYRTYLPAVRQQSIRPGHGRTNGLAGHLCQMRHIYAGLASARCSRHERVSAPCVRACAHDVWGFAEVICPTAPIEKPGTLSLKTGSTSSSSLPSHPLRNRLGGRCSIPTQHIPADIGTKLFASDPVKALYIRAFISRQRAFPITPKAHRLWCYLQCSSHLRRAASFENCDMYSIHSIHSTCVELQIQHLSLHQSLQTFNLRIWH